MSRWQKAKDRVLYLLNRLMWLLILGLCANTIYVLAFMKVEHHSFNDSMWWGWVTGFTVGYGDIAPASEMGRLIAICAMATDFILLAFFSGQITAIVIIDKNVLTDAEQELDKHRGRIGEQLSRAILASNDRIEQALGCRPNDLPVIPPFQTDEEIMAERAE